MWSDKNTMNPTIKFNKIRKNASLFFPTGQINREGGMTGDEGVKNSRHRFDFYVDFVRKPGQQTTYGNRRGNPITLDMLKGGKSRRRVMMIRKIMMMMMMMKRLMMTRGRRRRRMMMRMRLMIRIKMTMRKKIMRILMMRILRMRMVRIEDDDELIMMMTERNG